MIRLWEPTRWGPHACPAESCRHLNGDSRDPSPSLTEMDMQSTWQSPTWLPAVHPDPSAVEWSWGNQESRLNKHTHSEEDKFIYKFLGWPQAEVFSKVSLPISGTLVFTGYWNCVCVCVCVLRGHTFIRPRLMISECSLEPVVSVPLSQGTHLLEEMEGETDSSFWGLSFTPRVSLNTMSSQLYLGALSRADHDHGATDGSQELQPLQWYKWFLDKISNKSN